MFKPTIDMGYEIFEKREELTHTLAYALIDGLCKAADIADLLCDFTFGKKNYSGADLLCTAAALSKHIKAANFGERAGITIPPSFIAVVANYACILAKVKPINLNFPLGPVAAKSCIETENIKKASEIIFKALRNKKLVHVFATGHSHMFAEELFYRAGGLVQVNPILEPFLMQHEGSIRSTKFERLTGIAEIIFNSLDLRSGEPFIIVSNSGINSVPVEMAVLAKEKGHPVICVTSITQSSKSNTRNKYNKHLYEVCDVVIDNHLHIIPLY